MGERQFCFRLLDVFFQKGSVFTPNGSSEGGEKIQRFRFAVDEYGVSRAVETLEIDVELTLSKESDPLKRYIEILGDHSASDFIAGFGFKRFIPVLDKFPNVAAFGKGPRSGLAAFRVAWFKLDSVFFEQAAVSCNSQRVGRRRLLLGGIFFCKFSKFRRFEFALPFKCDDRPEDRISPDKSSMLSIASAKDPAISSLDAASSLFDFYSLRHSVVDRRTPVFRAESPSASGYIVEMVFFFGEEAPDSLIWTMEIGDGVGDQMLAGGEADAAVSSPVD